MTKGERIMSNLARRFAAIAAAAVLVAPAAFSAEAHNGKDSRLSEKSSPAEAPAKDRTGNTGTFDDIDYCKQKAHGLEGPARARFMTECLKRK